MSKYIAQGHKDREKDSFEHNLPSMQQRFTRLIIYFAVIICLSLLGTDISQACLQSAEMSSRKVYLRPKPDNMQFSHLFPVNCSRRPSYVCCDSCDYWLEKIHRYIKQGLE